MENIRGTSQKNVNDGFFDIRYETDGVYLTVYPPVNTGRRVSVDDVYGRLNRKKVKNYDRNMVELAVLKADKLAMRIAEPQKEEQTNATANVVVTPDKMKAFMAIIPPEGGRMLTVEELLEILGKKGVVNGINKTVLESLVKFPVYNEPILIAEGTPPVNGKSGYVEYFFDIKKDHKPTVLDDGRVDFRELNLIESVNKGQTLCTVMPPVPGTPGKSVTGINLPAIDGKSALLPRGRNVEPSEDGQSLLSSTDGQVAFIDGKVNVFATYEVKADVDNSTGNIYFVGNVIVRGNVLSGFLIDAGGNVEVWGVVEGAVIKAGGDIILRRGIQGLGKGVLMSSGDIVARYIEHSNIEAKNNIQAESIMHSNVKCGGKLDLAGKKGLLVGGTCKVGMEISAKVIGSHMATVTEIEVGIDPTLRDRYKTAKEELNSCENDIKKAEQAITLLKKLETSGMLTPDKQEMLAKSVRTKVFLSAKINELKEEINIMEGKLEHDASGRIRVQNLIYSGTKVAIGTCLMFVKDNLQYCMLYRDGADIKVGPYDK